MAYYNPTHEQPQGQCPAPIVYYAAPAIIYQQPAIKLYGPYYKKQTSIGLGFIHIVIACISIAAGVVAVVYGAYYGDTIVGIWTGAMYSFVGSLASAAGTAPTNSRITATLIFSLFGWILGITELAMASVGLREDLDCYSHCPYSHEAIIAANSMMVAAGSLEIIFGLWTTGICARAIDNAQNKAQMITVPVMCASHQPETVFTQAPSAQQPQPPPHSIHQQDPSTSNPQQFVEVHQAPLTKVKS